MNIIDKVRVRRVLFFIAALSWVLIVPWCVCGCTNSTVTTYKDGKKRVIRGSHNMLTNEHSFTIEETE